MIFLDSELKAKLHEFYNLTSDMINCLTLEDYDQVEKLMDKRQEVIEEINCLEYEPNEFIAICNDLNLQNVDKQLEKLLIEAKNKVQLNIKRLSDHRNAKNEYTRKFNVDSIYYNKKI